MASSSFTIYNASAGSGKTYTLVKEYLKILLSSNDNFTFKNILAITFTNKAVAEMKLRILDALKRFSDEPILTSNDNMFLSICLELEKTPEQIHKKAKAVLDTLLHNYGAFDISTIDGFTHKIIRTFARDLRLSLNFEVELDTDSLLNEAVDSLISKAGSDQQLTATLVDYALEKLDDNKSWNITYDLNDIAKLLVKENNLVFLNALKDKTIEDFMVLKTSLSEKIKILEKHVISKAQDTLDLISEYGLDHSDFNRSSLPNHFIKLSQGDFNVSFSTQWQENIEIKPLYPSRVEGSKALTMDRIQPQLAAIFYETRNEIFQINFYKNIFKNITPLSVLNSINKEMQMLQLENNKLLISEFNSIISQEIKDQPTPFIYERLGEKFKHYFIDEFQDTSVLQWENLKPLIANSLEQEQNDQSGTLMLVGDAKQAIYRWRGGEAEQFINLYSKKTQPFQIKQISEPLEANFRSFKQVVDFNNSFFEFISKSCFSSLKYGELYKSSKQKNINDSGGYVQLEFLDLEKEEDKNDRYCEATLKTIEACEAVNYNKSDICVLVRKNKEGIAVSNYLMERDINVVSADTLLLTNSTEVVFIVNLLTLLIQPKNQLLKADILYFIADKFQLPDKHGFIIGHITKDLKALFNELKDLNIKIDIESLLLEPLYDVVETIVRAFHLIETSDAFIQFFMDQVLDFSKKYSSDIKEFLDYFENKKDKLYVTSSESDNAVKVMTIHKSKGLEFPVVIFPFAELDIYKELKPQVWHPLALEDFNGFPHLLIDYKQDIARYGEMGNHIYETRQSELELDNINLLYVALTRAVEQLYIISKKEKSNTMKTYAGLFMEFLKHNSTWQENQLIYGFGEKEVKTTSKNTKDIKVEESMFVSVPRNKHTINIVTKSGYLWDTDQEKAIEKGTLIHAMLGEIKTVEDVENVIEKFVSEGVLEYSQTSEIQLILEGVLKNESLKPYFSKEFKVLNEKEIVSKKGLLFRPDKLVFISPTEVVLIDYKTGAENSKHIEQLITYENLLNQMALKVVKKILVYIKEEITVKEF